MVDNRASQVVGISGFFLALSWLFVSLRCYCRIVVVRAFGMDDYLCLFAQALFTVFCTYAMVGVNYGLGYHMDDITSNADLVIGVKWLWACEPAYVLSTIALKVSVGIFLLRIAVCLRHRLIIHTVMSISSVVGTLAFFMFIFQCNPPNYFWEQYGGTNAQGNCMATSVLIRSGYIFSALSCCSDWIYCILPGAMVWKLQMEIRTKLLVVLLLALSATASTATIARFPYIKNLSDKDEVLWAMTDLLIWSIVEVGLGLTASAGATLKPLLSTFLSKNKPIGDCRTRLGYTDAWAGSEYSRSYSAGNTQHKATPTCDSAVVLFNDVPAMSRDEETVVTVGLAEELNPGPTDQDRHISDIKPVRPCLRQWNEDDERALQEAIAEGDNSNRNWLSRKTFRAMRKTGT